MENSMMVDEQAEKNEILRRYKSLLRVAKPYLKPEDEVNLNRAFELASSAHQGMRRKSGEPYIFHPIEVAQISVTEIGLGATSIICALLHDVVEDTDITLDYIKNEFGLKVAKIIDGLTKISGVFEYGTSQQAENFRKMLLTLAEDMRVILIKIADRLHNMRTLDSLPRNKQLKIASETKYLYAPLAHRLGLYSIKSELEDLHLKYTDAEVYREIATKINDTKVARKVFIDRFILPIQRALKDQGFHFTIKGRPKSIFSIWNKMKKQKIPFEKVYDLFAIRITLDIEPEYEKAACWQVYSIVTDFYKPNPDRLRDWISNPKANGYESLHTTVMSKQGRWVEVQIRTRRMDEIAEKGYAAHWKYKERIKKYNGTSLDDWVAKVRTMLEQNNTDAIEFVDDFRSNLFSDEVFIFTPKGDLKTLPHGATALDFAFEIHSEVGAKCIGAKINQKLVPLNHVLKNGDQVEVLTSKKQVPNEDWLKFVVTSKARSKIKDILKDEIKTIAADGKEIVERKLKQLKLQLSSEIIHELLNYFKTNTATDLYYKIAKGIIKPSEIKKFRSETKQDQQSIVRDAKTFEKAIKKVKGKREDTLLIGEDMDVVDYTLAKCCNPIPGDDVFGFVTVSEGIKIHRTSCPNSTELMSHYGYRIVKAKWTSQKEIAFLTGLRFVGTDRVGLINDVTKIVSNDLKVNIRSIEIDTNDGIFEGNMMLFVEDTQHLSRLIQKLENVNGIVEISRFDS